MFDFEKNDLCVVDDDGGVVARYPHRSEDEIDGEVISWLDMSHDRRFAIKRVISDTADRFEFEDSEGRRFTLRPMSLALYERMVKPKLNGTPDVTNVRDLRRHFLKDTLLV